MRALGRALRVDPMAIYRHFENRDALVNAMIDLALADVEPPAADAGPPVERLLRTFGQFRRALAAHPGIAEKASTASPTHGANTRDAIEASLAALRELGMDGPAAARAYLALVRFVVGSVITEAALRAEVPTPEDWRANVERAYGAVPRETHPLIRETGDELVHLADPDESFEFTLRCLLDGLIRASTAPT